jgi:hypothetical protein
LAALRDEKLQQITELLKTMPVGKAAMLARTVSALRGSEEGEALPTKLILDALAPTLGTGRPDRSALQRMICMPLEPFLTNDAQHDHSAGLIQRAMLMPWWNAVGAVASTAIAAFEAELDGIRGNDEALDAFAIRARAAAATWTAKVLTLSDGASMPPNVRALVRRPASRIMLKQMFEILKEAEPLSTAIAAVMATARRDEIIVGDRLIDLTPDAVNVAKQHYLVLAASNVVVTRYFALAILNRLDKPWLIFRFTRALALQRDATIVVSTEFGPIGERLLDALERTASEVDSANPKGKMSAHLVDFAKLLALVTHYVDCAEGVLNEIDLRRDSPWGETMLRSRSRMRDALEEDRLRPAEDAIRAVLAEQMPSARRTSHAPDAPEAEKLARAEQALKFLTFIAQRASRQGFASPARKILDRVAVETEKCCEELIADLKLNPAHLVARRLVEPAVALANHLFPYERCEPLTRRLHNAAGILD